MRARMRLVVLLALFVAAKAAPAPEKLRIGILMPWLPVEGASNSVEEVRDIGEFIAPAILRSVENINSLQNVLPDTVLEWVWYDSRCDPNTATNAVLNMIDIWDVHAIIGPACDEEAVRVAPIATFWEVPFISYAAAATALSQKDIYPDFARVNGNYRSRNELFLRFARIHGWEQLALVYADSPLYSTTADDLFLRVRDEDDLSITFTEIFSPVDQDNAGQSRAWLPLLEESGVRIVIVLGQCADTREVLLSAKREFGSLAGYVFLLLDVHSECHRAEGTGWPAGYGPEADDEAAEAFDYTLSVSGIAFVQESASDFVRQLRVDWEENVFAASNFSVPPAGTIDLESGAPPRNPEGLVYTTQHETPSAYEESREAYQTYGAMMYDAIQVYARTADSIIKKTQIDPSVDRRSIVENLGSFDQELQTGFVSFNEDLDRVPDLELSQVRLTEQDGELSLSLTPVGALRAFTDTFTWDLNNEVVYPGGLTNPPIPFIAPDCTVEDYDVRISDCDSRGDIDITFTIRDGVVCTDTNPMASADCAYVPTESEGGIGLVGLAGAGVLLCVLCTIWVLVYRDQPIVKYAQPVFCLFFLLGALLVQISIILSVGENTEARCVVSTWMFHLGFTLAFAALLSKVYRVWRIFDNKKLRKRKLPISDMLKVMSFLLAVDVIILTIMIFVSPLSPREVERDSDGTRVDVPQDECGDGGAMLFLLWSIKIALMLGACVLSFQTRNVDMKFAESRYIMVTVYMITMLSIIGILVSTLSDSSALQTVTQGLTASIATTLALALIFAPKALVLFGLLDDVIAFGSHQIERSSVAASTTKGGAGRTSSALRARSQDNSDSSQGVAYEEKAPSSPRRKASSSFGLLSMGRPSYTKAPTEEWGERPSAKRSQLSAVGES